MRQPRGFIVELLYSLPDTNQMAGLKLTRNGHLIGVL